MPFCLTNSRVAFINLMNRYYLDEFVIVFLDDILFYSDKEKLHEEHLRKALGIWRKNKLYVKFNKCNFWIK